MGLKERRIIQNIQDNEIPSHVRMYKELTGIELEFDIDWNDFQDKYDAVLNLNGFVLQQAQDAFHGVGRDDLGKQALAEQVRTLKVVRVDDPAQRSVTLADGVLTLTVAPDHSWDGIIANSDIQEFLTENL